MKVILIIWTISFALGWYFENRGKKKLNNAYDEYIGLLEQSRDEWKKLAESRRIEGDEWKD